MLDRRADGRFGIRPKAEDRLGEDVGGGVPKNFLSFRVVEVPERNDVLICE